MLKIYKENKEISMECVTIDEWNFIENLIDVMVSDRLSTYTSGVYTLKDVEE